MGAKEKLWILTAQCPSRLGTVDVVTRSLAETENYIVAMNSFDDKATEIFSIRVEFRALAGDQSIAHFRQCFENRAISFEMHWELTPPDHRTRTAIMVSKCDHCLNDLLYRYRTHELAIEIPLIISNHPDLKPLADWHGIPYFHVPVTPETKPAQEAKVWDLINEYHCELVVLARYMQVLSSDMAANVNDDLDEGPIITQWVQAVDHSHYPEDLVAKGQDIESQTLARAVRYHTEKRVFLTGKRTVVFPD
ncbi:MAG: formyltransferase family protein [Gammaproteobacteria bacterium]